MSQELDTEHLRLLSLFYYIRGGIGVLFSCIFIFYIFMGVVFATAAASSHAPNAPPAFFGLLFVAIGGTALILGWTIGGLTIYAGHCLAQRKHRIFCMVIAAISCIFVPYGTALGVFTLIVLQRPAVARMFDQTTIAA